MEEERISRLDPIDIINSKLDDKKLHKHQINAIEVLDKYFNISPEAANSPKSGILVMPTGSGKTFTAVLIYKYVKYWIITLTCCIIE